MKDTIKNFRFSVNISKTIKQDSPNAASGALPDLYVEGYASTMDLDRQGDIIMSGALNKAADLLVSVNNTVFFGHEYSLENSVGRIVDAKVDDKGLKVTIFVSAWSSELRQKIEEGIINKFSIGGSVLKDKVISKKDAIRAGLVTEECPFDKIRLIEEMELFEVSFVGVPANPNAYVVNSFRKALEALYEGSKEEKAMVIEQVSKEEIKEVVEKAASTEVEKAAVPTHSPAKAPEDMPWNGDEAEMHLRAWAGGPEKDKIDWTKYKWGFAWYDEANVENFGSYKLAHHDVVNGEMVTVLRGVETAFAVMNGAMGGVHMPDKDREGVYRHLEDHYKEFGKEAPERKTNIHEEKKMEDNKDEKKEDIKEEKKEEAKETKKEHVAPCDDPECQDPACVEARNKKAEAPAEEKKEVKEEKEEKAEKPEEHKSEKKEKSIVTGKHVLS